MATSKDFTSGTSKDTGEDGGTKHGKSPQQAAINHWLNVPEAFACDRHRNEELPHTEQCVMKWRIRARMRTVCVGLIVALNIGVDPPDILKTDPCARMEAWIDINTSPSQKTLEHIGNQLQEQYSRMYARARFKQTLDPTTEEVKKMCMQLRRAAKDERVLIHYNGHGVPMPTDCGEIWVFNKNFTQYIPLSLYDLQSFITSPSIFVWDCSNAGQIVKSYDTFARQRRQDYEAQQKSRVNTGHPPPTLIKDYIHLAACSAGEILPMDPSLPADLFTACLTTPIEVAFQCVSLGYYKRQVVHTDTSVLDSIPGKMTDRKTMKGELFWIFTAITDTIAWNVLPRDLFQKLFRQDLLVAALFRNFLLAERVLTGVNCTPVSYPSLPPTHQHPMWQHWDVSVDIAISSTKSGADSSGQNSPHFPFFTNQLKAFEVWLELGSQERDPPEQLPIVLQVLLSQAHRLRALQLLQEFLDLGAWAVNLALSVGIFPYVLKLLQSPDLSIRSILCFIWTKVLMVDKSCQHDISKEGGEAYFIEILCDAGTPMRVRAMAAFCLSAIVDNNPVGQKACIRQGNDLIWKINRLLLQRVVLELDAHARKWICLCAAKVWEEVEIAKELAFNERAHETMCALLFDPDPEVRAAAALAAGCLIRKVDDRSGTADRDMGGNQETSQGPHDGNAQRESGGGGGGSSGLRGDGYNEAECYAFICESLVAAARDSSCLVRKEAAIALHTLLLSYHSDFVIAGHQRAARVAMNNGIIYRTGLSQAHVYSDGDDPRRRSGSTDTNGTVGTHETNRTETSLSTSSNGLVSLSSQLQVLDLASRTGLGNHYSTSDSTSARGGARRDTGPGQRTRKQDSTSNASTGTGTSASISVTVTHPEYSTEDNHAGGRDYSDRRHGGRHDSVNTTSRQSSLATSASESDGGLTWDGERERSLSSISGSAGATHEYGQYPHEYAQEREQVHVIPFELAWDELVVLSDDPYPEIVLLAQTIMDDLRTPGFERVRPVRFTAGFSGGRAHSSSMDDGFPQHAQSNTTTGSKLSAATRATTPKAQTAKRQLSSGSQSQGGMTNALVKSTSGLQKRSSAFSSTGDITKLIALEGSNALGYGNGYASGLRVMNSALSQSSINRLSQGGLTVDNLHASSRATSYDHLGPGGKAVLEPEETIKVDSEYYIRSCEYFRQPLLHPQRKKPPTPGSAGGGYGPNELRAQYIRTRNQSVLKKAIALEHFNPGDGNKYSRVQLAEHMTIQSSDEGVGRAFNVAFHPYNSLMVVANGLDHISVHDWSTHTSKSSFQNGNTSPNVCVTDVKLINEATESSLLLTGTDDGMVRVWRRYDEPGAQEIVTAWRGLADVPCFAAKEAGMLIDWCAHSEMLVSAGDWSVVSLWDAAYEKCTQLIETGSDSVCVSSLSHAPFHESLLVCGFGSGSVCLYDVRNSRAVMTLSDHQSWVLKTRIQSNSNGMLVSGSVDGAIKQWDLRKGHNVLSSVAHSPNQQMSALAIHNYAPLIASGTRFQELVLSYQADGRPLSTVQYHEGFLGQRIGPVNCLTFHPHETVLAAGGADSIVSVYRIG